MTKGNALGVHVISTARPGFIKIAPLYHELKQQDWCIPNIVHTGQNYDSNMSGSFSEDLRLPRPDIHLKMGSGSHAVQAGRVMMACEEVCSKLHRTRDSNT